MNILQEVLTVKGKTTKYQIMQALLYLDIREPDKTNSLWDKLAVWLHDTGELRLDK